MRDVHSWHTHDRDLTWLGAFRSPELEHAFNEHVWDKKMRQVRHLVGIFALLQIALAWSDLSATHQAAPTVAATRLSMVAAAAVAGAVSYRARQGRLTSAAFLFACLVSAVGTSALAWARPGGVYHDLPFILAVLVTTVCFVPMDGLFLLLSASALGVLYLGQVLGTEPVADAVVATSLFGFIWVMGALHIAARQRQAREFFLMYMDQSIARNIAEAEVAERAKVEVALRAANHEAQAASKAKSTFLATMSHEIRTPLNGILGLSELMQNSSEAPDPTHLRDLRSSADALRMLLEDVLDLSRMDEVGIVLKPRPLSLKTLATEALAVVRPVADARGLELRLSCVQDAVVMCDEGRMRQVLLNQLTNAVKFTEEGYVALEIKVEWVSSSQIRADISIEDTGPGISIEDQQRVFEAFTQLDDSSSRQASGAGLGLAICAKILEAMGSEPHVDSTIGQGTRIYFSVTLPATELPETTLADEFPAFSAHVLVVDDEPVNRAVMSGMLKQLGIRSSVATSGTEALEMVKQGVPELVLMDLRMPGMDGAETTRRLRARGFGGPIFALTADSLTSSRARCLDAGMNEVLCKPVNMAALARAVRRAESMQAVCA